MNSEGIRNAVLENARAIIAGDVGIIEGSIKLAALAHSVVPDWTKDEDFVVFGVVSSETDHLPTGSARQYWNPAALAAADLDIARIETSARSDVLQACQNIVRRFQHA